MARNHADSQQASTCKNRRQQEDQRRMAFRRAIESHCEERRLLSETADYPDFKHWQDALPADRRSARPGC